MPNSLIVPVSAALYFDREAPFSTRISPLSTAVRLAYDNVGALTVTSFVTGASAIERFRVEGTQGSLFSVTDVLTGVLFSVNDISGLPILTVQDTDTIIGGAFNTNTLVVSGTRVGIGVNIGTTKVTVSGGLSASGTIFASGGNSDQWNSVYTTVNTNSARYTTIDYLSSNNVLLSAVTSNQFIANSGFVVADTSTSRIFTASDNGRCITFSNTSPVTASVPAGLPVGFKALLIQINTGQVFVSAGTGVTINSDGGKLKIATQHSSANLISYTADVYNFSGNITT